MTSLSHCLARCFSPAEFAAEVLSDGPFAATLGPSLLPSQSTPPLTWFAHLTALCERHGILHEASFWTQLQRIRPLRCDELHRFRRQYVAHGSESAPPRVSAIDSAVTAMAQRFDTPPALMALLGRAGWRDALPPATSAVSLLHWILIMLVRARDGATLFRLASEVLDLTEAAATLDRLAICACDGEVPAALPCAWLDVQPGHESVNMCFRAWEPNTAVDGQFEMSERPVVRHLAADLSLSIALSPSGSDLEIRLSARCGGPWLGRTLRLCDGVHALFRRLMAPGGDRLGDDEETLLLLERLELGSTR